jgi:putative inorganic carbon (HCO3(-)) transporter
MDWTGRPMRSLFVSFCYLSFFAVGLVAPFALTLGYVWVDTFQPQSVAFGLINELPLSMMIAIAAFGGYVLLDRRDPPRVGLMTILLVLFAAWVTISTFLWAEVPAAAAVKWNLAVKTLFISAFIPLVIRSRIQIEAYLQILLFGFAIHFLPMGLKTLISGGGYGNNLEVQSSGVVVTLGADSRLAMIALMLVPIMLFLRQHTKILPVNRLTSAMYLTIIVLAVSAAFGTYERTGLVVAAVLATLLWLRSRRKVLGAIALAAAVPLGTYLAPADWMDRMATITEYRQEGSAVHRLDVWRWTFDYALQHPLGGGFEMHRIDQLGEVRPDGSRHFMYAHNDFFEVLGEQGWPGLAIFVGMIATTFFYLYAAARRARHFPHLTWCRDLAIALQMALVLQLTGGGFIALGYHPPLYMVFALSVSLREYVHRVEKAASGQQARQVRFAERGLASSA